MGPESSDRETPTATFAELQVFRAKAIEMGLSSLATAALTAWEWLHREVDIFATFELGHYRPRINPMLFVSSTERGVKKTGYRSLRTVERHFPLC
jgi:hypothetical protein